jgi:hypothetical protein
MVGTRFKEDTMRNGSLAALTLLALVCAPQASGQTLTIDHRPSGCAVAEKFPRLDARFAPIENIAAARIVFQPEKSDQWWSVTMKPEGLSYFGVLPKPKRSLKAFQYYVEVTDKSLRTTRTADYGVSVVASSGECSGRLLAGGLGSASVMLQGPAGVAVLPAGFASTGVVSGSVAGGAASATAGAASGGGLGTGVIVGGLGVAAAGVAVAAKAGGGDASSSAGSGASGSASTPGSTPAPSPSPSATPAPTPAPSATPAPTMAGHWVGDITIAGSVCFTDLTYDFVQTGNSFSGTGATQRRVSAGCSALNGTIENVAGVLTGTTFTFTDRFVTGSQFCNEAGSGSLSGNRATGSSQGTGVGTGACTTAGTFTITRQ